MAPLTTEQVVYRQAQASLANDVLKRRFCPCYNTKICTQNEPLKFQKRIDTTTYSVYSLSLT